ncbi:MAG: hypothetical protein Q7S40_06690 [Opitutaceae bacterium]|nr:hypothetical protein [Opitutaceae bacterium]
MVEKSTPVKKLSDKNTKQEMLEAYQALAKQLQEKREAELNPERQVEEKKADAALKAAAAIATEGIDREIGGLKSEIGGMLAEISEKLAAEATRFRNLQKAVEAKEQELRELYGIEKAASTLAALIEAQNQKRRDFETETAQQRDTLTAEIEETRLAWQKERQAHEAELRERDTAEKKAREREKEQFDYAFKRDQQTVRDKLADEKAALEKELRVKKEAAEKELTEREQLVTVAEAELNTLRTKSAAFPKELETAVNQAVKEATEKLKLEAKNREELLKKEFEGERNVFVTRVESLEKTAKDLAEQNARMGKQLEAAYQKVQEIAEKTIESAGHAKSLAELQKLLVEQGRKVAAEK